MNKRWMLLYFENEEREGTPAITGDWDITDLKQENIPGAESMDPGAAMLIDEKSILVRIN